MTGDMTSALIAEAHAASALNAERAATAWAWELWRQYLCEEANGGHLWTLHVREGDAVLDCESCGAYPDLGVDSFLYVNARVPVTVDIEAGHYPTDYGTGREYDLYVQIEPDATRIPAAGR